MNSYRIPLNFESEHWDWLTNHESQIVEHDSHDVDLLTVLDSISTTNDINETLEGTSND
jgi:hypothetical protein